MVNLQALYSNWVEKETLNETELKRVLAVALRHEDRNTLRAVLRQQSCTEEIVEQIKRSGSAVALAAWMGSRRITSADREWVAKSVETSVLKELLRLNDSSCSEELLKLMWRRRDTTLRFEILKRVEWHHHPPKSWGAWLLKARPFTEITDREDLVFESLGHNSGEFAWETVSPTGDVQLVAWVYAGLTEKDRRDWHTSFFLELAEEFVADPERDPSKSEAVATGVLSLLTDDRRGRTAPLVGSKEMALALSLLEILPEGSDRREELEAHLGDFASPETKEEAPRTREEILAALAAGNLPSTALAGAQACKNPESDELWKAVATHPLLRPAQAGALTRQFKQWEDRGEIEVILEGRKPSWVADFAQVLWNALPQQDRTFQKVAKKLSYTRRDKLLVELVTERPDGLERLVKMHLATSSVLGALPVSVLSSSSQEVQRALLREARWRLGENSSRWEIFETLLQEFTGTYGELLESSCMLDEEPNAQA